MFGVNAIGTDIQPRTKNIENVEFESRDILWGFDLDLDDINPWANTVDAKWMTDVVNIGSSYSDGDLVIENLTTKTSDGGVRNTDAITVTMDHTDNFNSDGDASDLTVYFDDNYLISDETTSGSTLTLRMLNALNNVEGENPIEGTIGFDFMVGDETVTVDISAIASDATLDFTTAYDLVVEAINEQLADAGYSNITATKLDLADAVFSIPVSTYDVGDDAGDYYPILVTNSGPETLAKGQFSTVALEEDTDQNNSMSTQAPEASENPLAVNVELHKVGRGDMGGDLIIGAKSEHQGIEVFNVKVLGDEDKPSNLGELGTTAGDLEEVYISTHEDYVDGETYASLEIRNGFNQNSLDLVDATDFLGELTLDGVVNLETLLGNGASTTSLDATINDATGSYNYSNSTDVLDVDFDEDDSAEFSLDTGAGDDEVDVDLDTEAIDTIGEFVRIDTGAGDDEVIFDGSGDASQLTMSELENVTINTGSGEDYVNIINEVRTYIEAGSDSDFVEFAGGDSGEWTFGQATGPQAFGDRVLYQATLTVTFAGFESTVDVETDADGNFVADQMTINAAIEAAIEANPELDRLLDVDAGTGYQQITVESLIGGENDLRVQITQPEVVADNATGSQVEIANSDLSALVQGLINTTTLDSDVLEDADEVETALAGNNFGGAQFDGNVDSDGVVGADYHAYSPGMGLNVSTDGGAENYSVINMGAGDNDLLVLDSNDNSANVLEITSTFGKVSVVNFHDDSPNDVTDIAQVGNHALDFTTYLNNQIDPSATTNTQSATSIALTLNTNAQLANSAVSTGTALANSVNMLNFDEDIDTDSVAWDDITAANLVEALNEGADATDFGGIDENTLDAVNDTADLIGDVQKHIVMVENDQNVGEYKVFSLTSTVDEDDGTEGLFDTNTAQLLGTLDFGNSINFNLVGSTEWAELIDDLISAADGVVDAPAISLAEDTGVDTTDGITNNPTVNVDVGAASTWIYTVNNGFTWTAGTGSSFDLAEGSYAADTIGVRETDSFGNITTTYIDSAVEVDLTAPAAPAIDVVAADNIINDAEATGGFDIVGTGVAGSTVTVNDGTDDVGTATVDALGDWTLNVASAAYAEGNVTFTATQTDAAGNESAASADAVVLVDTVVAAPDAVLTNDTGVSNSDGITSDPSITAPTNTEPGATVEYAVSVDGGAFGAWGNYVAPATDGSADGEYVVDVRQTDNAGNVSDPTLIEFTLDTTAPALAGAVVQNDVDSSTTVSDGDTVVFTFDEAVTTLGVVGGTATHDGGTLAGDGLSATFVLDAAAAATEDITLTGVADVAGNTADFNYVLA